MYVCVCHALNERRINDAISQGNRSVAALRRHFGFESCCGRCTNFMRDMIDRHQIADQRTDTGIPHAR